MSVSICGADIWAYIATLIATKERNGKKVRAKKKRKRKNKTKTLAMSKNNSLPTPPSFGSVTPCEIRLAHAHTRTHTLWRALHVNEEGFI